MLAIPYSTGGSPVVPISETSLSPKVADSSITVGRLSAFPTARALMLDGVTVELGARAFDLLIVLLSARGQVVPKEAIIRYVWPTTTVDDSNLRFQMSVLRRALGDSRCLIKTITGRGYMVTEAAPWAIGAAPAPAVEPAFNNAEGHKELRDALRVLIRAVGRHPSATA